MPLKNYQKVVDSTPAHIRTEVQYNMDILERLNELLQEKFDGKQRLLAEKLGKSEAEVSKMLNGMQNFTIRTLAKLEAAFDSPIIHVATSHHDATFAQVKMTSETSHVMLCVKDNGSLSQEQFTPTSINPGDQRSSKVDLT